MGRAWDCLVSEARRGWQARLLGHLLQLLDGLGRLLAALLKVRAVDLCVLGHELALVPERLLGRGPVHEGLVELLQSVILHGLVLQLTDKLLLFLFVELDDCVALNHGTRAGYGSSALSVEEVFISELAVII